VDADVVVVGAGALGRSTALHCALAGRPVVVVDRFTAGSQASGRAAGRFGAGPVPQLPGLWVASGCNGSGFSSSPALGEALATWITTGAPPPGFAALAPARFGPLPDDTLVTQGLWQYAHYYDPAPGAGLTAAASRQLPGPRA
jgi:glycine/D-amino acid oxidase-like deaminating enzyme